MNLDRRISSLEFRTADAPMPPAIVPTMTPAEAASAYAATLQWAGTRTVRVAPGDTLTPEQAAAAYADLIRPTTRK